MAREVFGVVSVYRMLVPLPPDSAEGCSRSLVRFERAVWWSVAAAAAVALVGECVVKLVHSDVPTEIAFSAVVTLAAFVAAGVVVLRGAHRHSAARAQREAQRLAERDERARLDGALLMARTAAHRLSNSLTPIVGYAELLTRDSAIRADERAAAYAELIQKAATETAAEIQRLQRIVRLEELPAEQGLGPGLPILDLDRSASGPPTE